MDRSLDEILAERKTKDGPRGGRGGGQRRRERDRQQDYPRDGVRKSFRDDAPRNLDTEWVHDRYEDNSARRSRHPRRGRDSPEPQGDSRGTKIRVDNLHWELTKEDLDDLFTRIGPVIKLDIRYDRAGRSEGTAFVTYESHQDAVKAVREFDGANANGQPIKLAIVPSGPGPRRNPFDTAVMPGRPLAERITVPGARSRSLSPGRDRDDGARKGIDRYVPGGHGSRSRSPMPNRRREGGRRPGARREGRGARREEGERKGRDGRPKKTQEELDAEMDNYFGGGEPGQASTASNGNAQAAELAGDDIDMIE